MLTCPSAFLFVDPEPWFVLSAHNQVVPDNRSRPSTRPKRPVPRPADAGVLPDLSDDPDDDTDEDIANVPLDYGRSEQTKVRGRRRSSHFNSAPA
jgi:hypothetical protein